MVASEVTTVLFDPSKLQAQVAGYSSWPLWKKWAALVGVSVPAVALLLQPFFTGKLVLGSQRFGYTVTITPSDEPILFITVVAVLEAIFAFMFYGLVKAFFFPRPTERDS
jgi:hypothetical protein